MRWKMLKMKNQTNLNSPAEELVAEIWAILRPPLEHIVEGINNILLNIAMTLRAQRESPERYQMRKWLSQIPHGGIIGNEAYLIVYNSEAPELSYIIKERI